MDGMDSVNAVKEQMHKEWGNWVKQRRLRQDNVDTPQGREVAWIGYEMDQMLQIVNEVRAERDLPPVGIEDVRAIDAVVCGLADYSHEFTRRCAVLAWGDEVSASS